MTSIRLSSQIEEQLSETAETENRSITAIIRQALTEYFRNHCSAKSSFEIGEDLFGTVGSGKTCLSRDYKRLFKKKLHEKHAH